MSSVFAKNIYGVHVQFKNFTEILCYVSDDLEDAVSINKSILTIQPRKVPIHLSPVINRQNNSNFLRSYVRKMSITLEDARCWWYKMGIEDAKKKLKPIEPSPIFAEAYSKGYIRGKNQVRY